MKKTTALCLALSLTLGAAGTAQADWERHGGYRGPAHEYRHHHAYRSSPGWVGPAALLAITGLAIGAAAYSQTASAQVYTAPAYAPPPRPVQIQPESGNWHYCDSSAQYYPYVRHCPEGWQAVMPPR